MNPTATVLPTEAAFGGLHREVDAPSLAARCTGICPAVMKSICGAVAASPVRRKVVGLSILLIILVRQGLPHVLTALDPSCDHHGVTSTLPLIMTAVALNLVTGAFIYVLVSNSKNYSPESRLHYCTAYYAVAAFVYSLLGWVPDVTMIGCPSTAPVAHNFAWVGRFVISIVYSLQNWLTYLKLELISPAAPVVTQVGGVLAKATVILFLVVDVLAICRHIFFPSISRLLLDVFLCVQLLCFVFFYGIFFWAMEVSARSALEESTQSDVDALAASKLMRAARGIRFATAMTLMSSVGTFILFVWLVAFPEEEYRRTTSIVFSFDMVLNVISAALLSDIVFARLNVRSNVQTAALSVEAKRRRQIETRLKAAVGDSTGSALTIAAFMEGVSPEKILAEGIERFRSISWDVLAMRPEIIVSGSPIDGFDPVEPNLYSLSQPCRLGDGDAFYSHSWRDSGEMKWKALTAWCRQFERSHKRAPRLWLDKVCVDQVNIDADLRSLPVYLAGCNTLFATSGSTYRSRLWCTMELLVYRMMLVADPSRSPPQVWMLGEDEEDCERQREEWRKFDVRDSECFHSRDKERFLSVLSRYPGGPDGFNLFIRTLADDFGTFVSEPSEDTESNCSTEYI